MRPLPCQTLALAAAFLLLACDAPPTGTPTAASVASPGTDAVVPEFPVIVSPTLDKSTSVAFDGTNYLVAFVTGSPATIKARLVSPAGAILATVNTGRFGDNPLVAFDGTNYLLAWLDRSNMIQPDVNGWFVNTAGAKVGTRLRLTNTADAVIIDALCFGGGQYMVTYNRFDSRIHRRFISTAGVRGPDLPVSSSFGIGGFNSCATDGTDFLAFWVDSLNHTVARLVRGNGTIGVENVIDSTADSTSAIMSASFLGSRYLLAWADKKAPGDWDTYARQVNVLGTPVGNRITIEGGPNSSFVSSTTANGSNVAVWYSANVNAPANATSNVRFVNSSGALTGSIKTVFLTKQGGLVPIGGPVLANGTSYFFALNRAIAGVDPLEYADYTGWDVKGALATLVP